MPHSLFIQSPFTALAVPTRPQQLPPQELSTRAREILGRSPSWILRSGIMVVAVCVAMLLVLACIIQYPDTVSGKMTITGTNPAVAVMSRQSGHLERLAVKEGQRVEKGHLLGIIKSAADAVQLLQLRETLTSLQPFLADMTSFKPVDLRVNGELGVVQSSYGDFHTRYQRYVTMLSDDYAGRSIASLKQQLVRKQEQLTQMNAQVASSRRESGIAKETFDRMQTVHARGGISNAELQQSERQLLEQQRQTSMVDKAMLEEEIAAADYDKQIRELTHKRDEDLRTVGTELAESLKKLSADIEQWETDYVLRAPTDGTVAFYDFWADQQFVTQGKTVFIIAPESTVLLGRIPVQQGGAGKIKPGQIVRVRLDDFPSREFGMVSGTVKSVSLVAQQGQQLVSVSLGSPLISSYRKAIPFKQEMTGEAMIVTDDQRLIGRLFNEIRRALFQPAS